jgi:hypothetical protein
MAGTEVLAVPRLNARELGNGGRTFYFCSIMDRTLTYTVTDLASDEAIRLRCDCRVRTYGRAELAALVGRDARLHLIGLNRELWCRECGEPPFIGWVTAAVPNRP